MFVRGCMAACTHVWMYAEAAASESDTVMCLLVSPVQSRLAIYLFLDARDGLMPMVGTGYVVVYLVSWAAGQDCECTVFAGGLGIPGSSNPIARALHLRQVGRK